MAYNAFLGLPTLQVLGDPTLCLLGLKDVRAAGVISIRGDVKRAYDCDVKRAYDIHRAPIEAGLGRVPPRLGYARGEDIQDTHPARGLTQQDGLVIDGGAL
jgi:hypothetical protein